MRTAGAVLIAVVACCVLGVFCAGARAELGVELYGRPVAVVGDGRVYVFASLEGVPESVCVCFRQDAPDKWVKVGEFKADHSAVAYAAGVFYVFLPESVIAVNAENCRKQGEAPWPFHWRPQSVQVINGELVAFGVSEGKGEMHMGSAPLAGDEPGRDPATTEPASPPERYGDFLRENWTEKVLSPNTRGRAEAVRTVVIGSELWCFWTTVEEGGERRVVWSGMVDGDRVELVDLVAKVDGVAGLAACAFDGQPCAIYAALPEVLGLRRHIRYRRRDGGTGRWLPEERATETAKPFVEIARGLAAVSVGRKAYVFLDTNFRVALSTYDGTAWTPVRSAVADSRTAWLAENMGIMTGAFAVGLLLFVVSLVRARTLPHRVEIAEYPYVLARWWQRSIAYVPDLIIAIAAVDVMHLVAGQVPSMSSVMLGMFSFEMVYHSMFEARAGRTPGKRLAGVLIVSRNGGYPSWSEAALRNLPRALVDSLLLTWLWWAVPFGWLVGSVVMLNTTRGGRAGWAT